jgi:Na+-translocating ferredoxin:NAD+ oxidoreductase RnfG subunit
MSRRAFIVGLAAAFVPQVVRAEHYLDTDEAARLIFPDADSFTPAPAELDRAAARAIKDQSGMRVRQRQIDSLAAMRGGETIGWVYVDNVIGKHEFITYAAGIDAAGAVRGIEILDYRETYGGEVREDSWRAQLVGRTLADPPVLNDTVQNISGATLSCRNVTDGVRRLLATHAVLSR